DDAHRHAGRRAQHVDRVVAFERIDLQHLDVLVGDGQPGAKDAVVGDDDVVGEFGAEDDQLVEAAAAVYRDRRVDVVLDLVVAAPWLSPPAVRISVSAAVEKPEVNNGFAIICTGSTQTMSWEIGSVSASANARTVNKSLSSSPSSRNAAWLL